MFNPISQSINTIRNDFSILLTGEITVGFRADDKRINLAALRILAIAAIPFACAAAFSGISLGIIGCTFCFIVGAVNGLSQVACENNKRKNLHEIQARLSGTLQFGKLLSQM